jgi:hypothetical protein
MVQSLTFQLGFPGSDYTRKYTTNGLKYLIEKNILVNIAGLDQESFVALTSGFTMLASINTMDRFDDPKGKQIYIPQTD